MDYKSTLNLPQTGFAMKADLVQREPQRLEKWRATSLYERIQQARAGRPTFVLHDGPPFANGEVHVGTALNKILKDIVIRHRTLRGFNAPYVPGWDCHGLPIEFKVSQEMRKAGDTSADPVTIRRACDAYARKYIDLQRTQFKRLGVLGDWEHPYLTLDQEYEADELRLFADIVEKGFVYRGKKPVYWSIPARTALAEAEVEYHDHVSPSVYVKFPVVGQLRLSIVIWTTTPWTLPANLAVAYNQGFSYSLVRAGEDSYIVSTMLLPTVAATCGWDGYEIIRSLHAEDLAELEYQHPFCTRTGRLHPAPFVENSTGTGFVHIAPGHGLEDYGLGSQLGLPIYSPVDDDGRLALTNDLPRAQQMPDSLVGQAILEKNGRSDANEAVLTLLREGGNLLKHEPYSHSYPHCWRSKTPVIFRAMDQWFIRIDHAVAETNSTRTTTFREQATAEIGRVKWVPDWGINRIKSVVESRPDWCISRQRTWGVPIPAFYDREGHALLDARIVRLAADVIEQHGSNVWFEKSAAELWTLCRPSDWDGPDAVTKSNDTLDVWIDSGSSSRAVLMRRSELHRSADVSPASPSPASRLADEPPALPWQADLYLEGSDQHRGWFQSSLLLSLAGNGAAPYKAVLTHGFMVDEDREKISKSKQGQGIYLKPQTAERFVNDFGADVLRLWVASQDFRNDIVVSEERLKKVAETYRLLRNTLRYQLSNLYDFHPAHDAVADADLTELDRWILGEFSALERAVDEAYQRYEFHVVYQRVSQFVAVELSSIYHDVVKDRLYTDPANSRRRRSTQTALHRMVTGLSQMLSPLLVFTADEAWEAIPAAGTDSVHQSEWTPSNFPVLEAEQTLWSELFALREQVLPELEKARQAKLIGKALEAKVSIGGLTPHLKTAGEREGLLAELLNVSALELTAGDGTNLPINVAHADGQKCERCWHWETTVGARPEYPTLCSRCVEAVQVCLAKA